MHNSYVPAFQGMKGLGYVLKMYQFLKANTLKIQAIQPRCAWNQYGHDNPKEKNKALKKY